MLRSFPVSSTELWDMMRAAADLVASLDGETDTRL